MSSSVDSESSFPASSWISSSPCRCSNRSRSLDLSMLSTRSSNKSSYRNSSDFTSFRPTSHRATMEVQFPSMRVRKRGSSASFTTCLSESTRKRRWLLPLAFINSAKFGRACSRAIGTANFHRASSFSIECCNVLFCSFFNSRRSKVDAA